MMDMPHHIRMLARYNAWANELLFSTLKSLHAGEEETYSNSGWQGMLKTLSHANVIDQIWQAHLEGKLHGFAARNTETIPALETLHTSQRKLDQWYIDYADTLPAEQYEEPVRFTLIGGNPGIMTRTEILLHVVNHKTYHRGYVAQALYDLAHKPPTMDLPVFFREVYAERKAI
jgi:uncharacterized damage-inducible protein DinB